METRRYTELVRRLEGVSAAGASVEIVGSVEGYAVYMVHPKQPENARRNVLLTGGVHGDEPAGPLTMQRLLEANAWPRGLELCAFPCLNPTGFPLNRRENAAGVDLNRAYRHLQTAEVRAHVAGLALGTAVVKAVALPWFLRWAIREANVRREMEPLVGYVTSLLIGAAVVAASFAVAPTLPLPGHAGSLLVAVALSNVLTGLVVLTSRLKALTQVVGYLMLENGIYVFGLTQTQRVPFLLEMGVLLDVFVGVFIMGIVVFHINREFDTVGSDAGETLDPS